VTARVVVVGMPSAAGCASDRTWRAAAAFLASRLRARFGDEVAFEYAELFSSDMERHPEIEAVVAAGTALPPVVSIHGVVAFSGGKLNVSAIERAVGAALRAASDAPSPHMSEAPVP